MTRDSISLITRCEDTILNVCVCIKGLWSNSVNKKL